MSREQKVTFVQSEGKAIYNLTGQDVHLWLAHVQTASFKPSGKDIRLVTPPGLPPAFSFLGAPVCYVNRSVPKLKPEDVAWLHATDAPDKVFIVRPDVAKALSELSWEPKGWVVTWDDTEAGTAHNKHGYAGTRRWLVFNGQ